jgi:Condensation domain
MTDKLLSVVDDNPSAQMVQPSSPIGPEFIRPLGTMERTLWLLDHTHPTHFALAAEIEGPTRLAAWRSALDAVQLRHPFFSVCIEEDGNANWSFRRVAGTQIPLRVVNTKNATSRWEREIETELATRFDARQAPLIRAVLLHQPDKSILIFSAHHSIGDGLSMAFAIRDVLQALSGERLDSLPPLASMEELLGMPQTQPARRVLETSSGSIEKNVVEAPRVKGLRLSPELTSKLLGRSRQEETTLHGALCAALVLAGRQLFSTWNNPVRIHSAIDARRLLHLGDNYMQLSFGGIVAVNPDAMLGFWDIARFMKSGLAVTRSLPSMIAGLGALNDLLLQGLDPHTFSRIARESYAHEATLTNLGSLPFNTSFQSLKLTSLWGPAIDLDGVGQTIGAATTNGSLCLLYTSSAPAPPLLEVMQQAMVAACHAS